MCNNGHYSGFFPLKRGVRQGDPISPNLFILCLEFLSAAIKNNRDINELQINDSEYLFSQYADDSTLILDDDGKSLNSALDLISRFSKCSGLNVNYDKTEAVWILATSGCVGQIDTIK